MQNRYAGDVGDFSKFGLLRQIATVGFAIGLNWYLVADEAHNKDGKHIGYLTDSKFDGCDDQLRELLCSVANGDRNVSMLEKQNLINNATYFSEPLSPPATSHFSRSDWHNRAMEKLHSADIIFLDPDNGVLVNSVSPNSNKSIKYAMRDEIIDYYYAGHSVIFYNHRCRENEVKYLKRFEWMYNEATLKSAKILGLKFVRGSTRDYIFAIQPKHIAGVFTAIDAVLQDPWKKHFTKLNMP